ncbi:MAG: hypothetical protein U0361_19960 [Nitrospiraceae bacterium]
MAGIVEDLPQGHAILFADQTGRLLGNQHRRVMHQVGYVLVGEQLRQGHIQTKNNIGPVLITGYSDRLENSKAGAARLPP